MVVVLILLVLTSSLQQTSGVSSSSDCSDDTDAPDCDCDCDTCAGAADCCMQKCDNCRLVQSNVVYLPYPYPVMVPPGPPMPGPPMPPPPYMPPYVPPYIPPLTPSSPNATTSTPALTTTTEPPGFPADGECTGLAKCTKRINLEDIERVRLFSSLKLPSAAQMLRMSGRKPRHFEGRGEGRKQFNDLDDRRDLRELMRRAPPQLYRPSRNFYDFNNEDFDHVRTNF